jgi:hypothetical protein
MKMPFIPTSPQIVAALEDVLYEIEMFTALPAVTQHPLLNNCLTESFLLHARILCDFFQKPRFKDDVICDDYGFPQRSLQIKEDIEVRFDKCLAHVTYARGDFRDDAKQWILDYFQPRLLERIVQFLEHLGSNCGLPLRDRDIEKAQSMLKALKASEQVMHVNRP